MWPRNFRRDENKNGGWLLVRVGRSRCSGAGLGLQPRVADRHRALQLMRQALRILRRNVLQLVKANQNVASKDFADTQGFIPPLLVGVLLDPHPLFA